MDSIFNDSAKQKEQLAFGGVKSSSYHDSKNNISILDHLPKATTNCRLKWNVSLGIHREDRFFFLFLEGEILIAAAAVVTVA